MGILAFLHKSWIVFHKISQLYGLVNSHTSWSAINSTSSHAVAPAANEEIRDKNYFNSMNTHVNTMPQLPSNGLWFNIRDREEHSKSLYQFLSSWWKMWIPGPTQSCDSLSLGYRPGICTFRMSSWGTSLRPHLERGYNRSKSRNRKTDFLGRWFLDWVLKEQWKLPKQRK